LLRLRRAKNHGLRTRAQLLDKQYRVAPAAKTFAGRVKLRLRTDFQKIDPAEECPVAAC
jgi:hypothetical protein